MKDRWNFRVVKSRGDDGIPVYTLREAHYDGAGELLHYGSTPVTPSSTDLGFLKSQLVIMIQGADSLVIDETKEKANDACGND
jgi:hypothetical protein